MTQITITIIHCYGCKYTFKNNNHTHTMASKLNTLPLELVDKIISYTEIGIINRNGKYMTVLHKHDPRKILVENLHNRNRYKSIIFKSTNNFHKKIYLNNTMSISLDYNFIENNSFNITVSHKKYTLCYNFHLFIFVCMIYPFPPDTNYVYHKFEYC